MWGRRALERRGRETSGSLEQRKSPTLWEDRRPPRPGPERPKGVSAVPGSSGVQASTLTGTDLRIKVRRTVADAGTPRRVWLAGTGLWRALPRKALRILEMTPIAATAVKHGTV